MGPMGTKSRLCLDVHQWSSPAMAIGIHRLPVPGRLWQVHYTFNLRDFAKNYLRCAAHEETGRGLTQGPPGPWCWHVDGQNVTGNILMSNLYECHIWMPLICHKYIVHVYIYIYIYQDVGNMWFSPVFGVCVWSTRGFSTSNYQFTPLYIHGLIWYTCNIYIYIYHLVYD